MSIPDLPPNTRLDGRSILITGSNQGIGYSAALLSLQLGASPVYLAVRTVAKGRQARDTMLADPIVQRKNKAAVVEVYELDMARWESVQAFSSKFIADRKVEGQGLDIAILNAGLVNMEFELAPTGNEMSVQVNHLSTTLLSLLLLPLLEASTTPQHTARLTVITSSMHKRTSRIACPPSDINYLASLNDPAKFSKFSRYGLSKLLLIFWLRHLSARWDSNKVIVNNVCPGMISTNFGAGAPMWTKPLVMVMKAISANPVEKGAECYVHAVECVGKESHGLWYRKMSLSPYADFVTTAEGAKTEDRIWKETMEVLDKVSPGIGSVVP